MMNELLDMSDRWEAAQPAFKVAKVKLGFDFSAPTTGQTHLQ